MKKCEHEEIREICVNDLIYNFRCFCKIHNIEVGDYNCEVRDKCKKYKEAKE